MDTSYSRTLIQRFLSHFHPSAFLLATQVLILFSFAIFDELPDEQAMINGFGVAVVILIVWVVNHSPAINWIAWALSVPAVVFSLLSAFLDTSGILVWSSLINGALYLYAAGSLIAYMLHDDQVTTDELYAIGATFTLIAWAFAYYFQVNQIWDPGSYTSVLRPGENLPFIELLFLSFTNLSSVGISDVYPVSTTARVLVMIEQMTGVGYIAMVVSRLVGLAIQRQARRGK